MKQVDLPKDETEKLNKVSINTALEMATLPVLANRFEIVPHPYGPKAGLVLILGGVLTGKHDDETFRNVRMHGAYAIDRKMTALLATRIKRFCALTPNEVSEAENNLDAGADE